jgi:hypothetical protein
VNSISRRWLDGRSRRLAAPVAAVSLSEALRGFDLDSWPRLFPSGSGPCSRPRFALDEFPYWNVVGSTRGSRDDVARRSGFSNSNLRFPPFSLHDADASPRLTETLRRHPVFCVHQAPMGRRKITPNAWRRNARKIGSFPLVSSSEPRAPDSAGCGRWGALVCGAPGEVFQDAADQTRPGDEGTTRMRPRPLTSCLGAVKGRSTTRRSRDTE